MSINIEELFNDNIDNYSHLLKIRKKLLSTDVKSKVSIMVGAGFSRNAAKIEDSFEEMALWDDLKKNMVQDLNNHKDISNKSVLEIGELYSYEYGRSALDDLLKSLIPDENYEPTDLYNKLLNLPWADVYTTNYDTLLERSKANIYERNYQVVYDISDIPTSVQPRIVKLHGSFPANRPFVFTKKDYDDYPIKFSPFVNMVQQAIMESTFLLIGFSGDDPNFEKWTSWVRNNLKDHMPKIYMIGINEGEKQKQLEEKGITLIDFKNVYPDSINYSQMFNDLFDYLSPRKEEEKTNWPFYNISLSKLNELKRNYPGWVVLPDNIRRDNYSKIVNMIRDSDLVRSKGEYFNVPSVNSEDNTAPIFNHDIINDIVNILWFMDIFKIPMTQAFEETILFAINSQIVDNYQLNLFYLTLLKEKRLDNDKEGFNKYKKMIMEQDFKFKDNHSYCYELIQYYIENNKLKEAIKLMNSWEVGEREPEWGVKKACLYLKLNKTELAINLFDKYLKIIRRLLAIKNNDYRLLSLESIILSHFRSIRNDSDYAYERLKSLSLKGCHSEKEFTSTLRTVRTYKVVESRQENETFDPEITNTRVYFGIELDNRNTVYESFVVSQINEQYQLEKNISKADFERLVIAFENVKYIYKYSSFKKLIFLNNKELLDKLFKRSSIVYLQQEFKDILIELLEPTLIFDNEKSLIRNKNALDLYSRIYMRLSINERLVVHNKVLNTLSKIYYDEFDLNKKTVALAIKRMCRSLGEDDLNQFVRELIELEIPEDINFHIRPNQDVINRSEFFDSIYIIYRRYYSKVNKLKINTKTIKYLLDKLQHSKNIDVQRVAFVRLIFLAVNKKITAQIYRDQLNEILNSSSSETIHEFNNLISLAEYESEGRFDLFDKNSQIKALKNFLTQSIPNFYEENDNQRKFHEGQSTVNYFRNVTVFFGHFENQSRTKTIDKQYYYIWLDKFYEWWGTNKKGILYKSSLRSLVLVSEKTILDNVVNALKNSIFSILPLEYLRQKDKWNLEKIFYELLKIDNSYAVSFVPLLERLKISKEYNIHFTKILIDESIEIESKINALSSLFLYTEFSKKREIKLTNEESKLILDELKNAINYSEGLILEEALYIFSKIIDFTPQLLDENYTNFSINYLDRFLKNLKRKIAISQESLKETNNIELKLLSAHARLASIIIKHKWSEKNIELKEWKDFILSHPLPEVKINKGNF